MTLDEDEVKDFQRAARPLVEWLRENCHPHCTVTVTATDAFLAECVASVPFELED